MTVAAILAAGALVWLFGYKTGHRHGFRSGIRAVRSQPPVVVRITHLDRPPVSPPVASPWVMRPSEAEARSAVRPLSFEELRAIAPECFRDEGEGPE